MSTIVNIAAYEILDSRGIPTLLAEVELDSGVKGSASVPSGASTGIHEALELRDKDKKRFNGKGVLNNIRIINSLILDALIGLDVRRQKDIDELLLKLDGTKNKKKLGANTILSVSLAVAKAASNFEKKELYKYLGGVNSYQLPIPLVNIINGGAHANNNLDIQEYMITPIGAKTFKEAIRWCAEIFYNLKDILKIKNYSTAVGDEGGFASSFQSNEEPIECLIKSIKASNLSPEKQVMISLDVAATEFYKSNKYILSSENKKLISSSMVDYLVALKNKFPIFSIEDGLAEDDWTGWKNLTEKITDNTLIIGDDLFVTNKKRLLKGIKNKAANSILIKLNQIGSLSETLDTINISKRNGYKTIISHRSGETEDTFISDFAVATNAMFIKSGSVTRSERCAKYNRLIMLEKLDKNLIYSGLVLNEKI
ncbi:MAG: Enolase [Alphaproteobacteria bacterium MarineAlpha9_Bin4]|nr:phosphopyruvate hydratase [Pelagibacterales bacterium]PPR27614.1 MAG: Enolase [Alphaproteobacteria bacterium MarineAlpha9_Bin4]|tara:strand:+ start:1702 stop:2979 length:1278 start_codon:yes stop_codon:yes gene_type:complete